MKGLQTDRVLFDLDDLKAISALDREGLLKVIVAFEDQCREAVKIARAATLTLVSDKIENIVVMGMGGSGISGDVSRALFDDELKVPLFVNRDYRLPAFVGPGTLAIAVSYSGNTEETLAGLKEAIVRGAQPLIISTGGKISEIAVEGNFSLVTIPAGLQPRASLGYLSLPIAVVLERLGLIAGLQPALDETFALIGRESERFGPDNPVEENPAKKLARDLYNKMAVVYGSEGLTGVAAFRFRCQLNENAKSPAKWNIIPELDHNELAGWEELNELSRQFRLVLMRDVQEHPQVKKRFDATSDLIIDQFDGANELWSTGESKLARLFSLIYLGDFASVYLAFLNGVDPSPVERIELLKKRLAR